MKTFLPLFFTVLICLAACQLEKIDPETPVNTFDKLFNTGFKCKSPSLLLENDGGIRILSNEGIVNGGPEINNPAVFLLDPDGQVLWKKIVSTYDVAFGPIIPTDAGTFFASFGKASELALGMVELDQDGDVINEYASSPFFSSLAFLSPPPTYILRVNPQKVLVCGNTEGNDSLHVVAFEQFNGTVTPYKIANIADTYGYCIQSTQDGGFMVCGNALNGSTGPRLVKLDADGQILWNKNNYNVGQEYASWAVQTSDGGYLVSGYSPANGIFLLKTDANGLQIWSDFPFSGQYQFNFFLLPIRDGNFLLCGAKDFKAYAAKIKVEANGPTVLWEKTYSHDSRLVQAVETSDGGFLMIGAADFGLNLVRTDRNGNVYQ